MVTSLSEEKRHLGYGVIWQIPQRMCRGVG
jgi:hypothetical protein